MRENSRTPISPNEKVVLDYLEQYVDTMKDDESITREDVISYLVEQGIERTDAQVYIKQLLLKGYLYEVNDELRIPPQP